MPKKEGKGRGGAARQKGTAGAKGWHVPQVVQKHGSCGKSSGRGAEARCSQVMKVLNPDPGDQALAFPQTLHHSGALRNGFFTIHGGSDGRTRLPMQEIWVGSLAGKIP